MYPEMFCCDKKIEGKDVSFIMIPDFRQVVTVCNEESKCQYYSDTGNYTISEEMNRYGYYNVYASENDRWFVEQDFSNEKLKVYITQWTNEILMPVGENFNQMLNKSLNEVTDKYYQEKNTEMRLYFYDSENDVLTLSRDYDCSQKYRYSLERFGVEKSWIDERFNKPIQNCFILGTIRRTIGSKRGMLHDFINPIYQVNWDLKKDGDWKSKYEDFTFSDNYYQIEENLMMILKFTIRNEYYFDYILKRIKNNYYRGQNFQSAEEIAEKFNSEIMDAFRKGNLDKLIKLHNIITSKQDCTDQNFKICLKDNQAKINKPEDIIYVEFENGERDYSKTVDWIYHNKQKLKNAICIYLGSLKGKYQISEWIV